MSADSALTSSTLTNTVGRIFLINLKTTQKSVKAEGTSLCTQQLITGPYPQTDKSIPHPPSPLCECTV